MRQLVVRQLIAAWTPGPGFFGALLTAVAVVRRSFSLFQVRRVSYCGSRYSHIPPPPSHRVWPRRGPERVSFHQSCFVASSHPPLHDGVTDQRVKEANLMPNGSDENATEMAHFSSILREIVMYFQKYCRG